MENKCAMIPLGLNEPCKRKLAKNSIYCNAHKRIMRLNQSKVVLCLKCNKGTTAKLQICDKCGGKNEREKQRYIDVIKPRRQEIARLKKENTLI